MKYSQAIIIAALGTSALVAGVPLPTQNNNGAGTASTPVPLSMANNYNLWPRDLLKDIGQVGSDVADLPGRVVANTIRRTGNAMVAAKTAASTFVNSHATIPASGSGTASPGATFRRDLELDARYVLGESGTQQNPQASSLFGSVTQAVRQAARQAAITHAHDQIDKSAQGLKYLVSGFLGSHEGPPNLERRAPGQEGASSLSSDLLNKRRNIEEYSVHERDFEDYDIYGRDLEIANLD